MLEGKSKIYKHKNAGTLYVTIPAKIATDSQFHFKAGDSVLIRFSLEQKRLEITKKENKEE